VCVVCVWCVWLCVSYTVLSKNGPLQLLVNTHFPLIYTDGSYAFGMTPAASQQNTKKKNYEESRTNKLIGRNGGTEDKATKKLK